MKRPSTVAEGGESVIIPLMKIHATPARGIKPSTTESTRIRGRILVSPFLFFFRLRICFAIFTPELVTGAMDKHVFQRGLAHGDRQDLPGKSLHHIRHKPVAAFPFDANLIP